MEKVAKINSEYIKTYLKAEKIPQRRASDALGKSPSYISMCFQSGTMTVTAVKLLCHEFGMDYSKAVIGEVTGGIAYANSKKMTYVNADYIRALALKSGESLEKRSIELGRGKAYYSNALHNETIEKSALRYLCTLIGADYEKATTPPKKEEEKAEMPETAATGAKPVEDITQTIYDCTQLAMDDVKQLAKDMDDLKREVRETRAQMLGALKDIHATLKEIKQHNISVEVEKRQTRISMNKAIQESRGYIEKMSGILQARK